jgi:hypothetical protein
LEESIRQDKEHIHEMQERLTQEHEWRIELQCRIEHQSQSTVDLEEERDRLQKLSSDQENHLRQFAYV